MLSLDWNLLFTCINLVVFYVLIKKFVWNKVLGAMKKRQDMIDKQFKDASDAETQATELKTSYEARLATVSDESQRIIADAKLTAKTKADKIVTKAQNKSDKMVKDARETIEKERQATLRSVKSDIADIAMTAAAKVVGKEASKLDNSAIYDDFLNENGDE